QAKSLAEDASVLVYKQVVSEKENQKHFNISELKRLANYKAYLYEWLKPFGFRAWEDIYELTEAQSGKIILSENYRLLKDREYLILEPIKEKDSGIYEIIGNEIKTPIPLKISETDQIIKASDTHRIYVDKETLKFPLHIRKWREGDYFCPTGIDGKKKVSKYFKDEKMTLSEKENTWLLISDNKIVWIIGKRSDRRFYVSNTTQQILKIEILK
ncbi:MAG: tRNA(Ile)-lysidine synthetase, partial [Flavobacterium johnsoniae]